MRDGPTPTMSSPGAMRDAQAVVPGRFPGRFSSRYRLRERPAARQAWAYHATGQRRVDAGATGAALPGQRPALAAFRLLWRDPIFASLPPDGRGRFGGGGDIPPASGRRGGGVGRARASRADHPQNAASTRVSAAEPPRRDSRANSAAH